MSGLFLSVIFMLGLTSYGYSRPAECGTLEQLNQQYASVALDHNAMQLKSLAYQWYNANCRGMKTDKRTKPLKRR